MAFGIGHIAGFGNEGRKLRDRHRRHVDSKGRKRHRVDGPLSIAGIAFAEGIAHLERPAGQDDIVVDDWRRGLADATVPRRQHMVLAGMTARRFHPIMSLAMVSQSFRWLPRRLIIGRFCVGKHSPRVNAVPESSFADATRQTGRCEEQYSLAPRGKR
ncbi:hypothetical protein [Paracoccus sp. S3-43]|uniref:hypothetical protein n=1 Tax=Paracoccus sp. S3-43 TaxID=3030011 RepID=UPI0023AF066C|nr:hypothetical protein [Paracoccus sp. S3-43]WEF24711.1 hypothetical protein PXD02_01745 [Paracoccus sp. S3-43]